MSDDDRSHMKGVGASIVPTRTARGNSFSDIKMGTAKGYFLGASLSVVVIFACCWACAAFGKAWFYSREYGMWSAKKELVSNCGYDIAIVGDSPAMAALVPMYIGGSVINLAVGGATPIEVYYVSRRLLQCPKAPKKIILSVSPLHFLTSDTYWPRTAAFHYLTLDEMEDVRRRSASIGDAEVYEIGPAGSLIGMTKNYLYRVDFPYFYLPDMLSGFSISKKNRNERIMRQTEEWLGYHYFGTANGSRGHGPLARSRDFKILPLLNEYFVMTIELFKQKNIPVVFMNVPINEATDAALSAHFKFDLSAYITAFARRGDFRLVGEVLPVLPSVEFGDADHLRPRAAIEWTRGMAAEILRPN
jgi:hypothetical protein